MKRVIAVILICILPHPSFAFDIIKCESQMKEWSVWNGFGKKDKILDDLQQTISLPERHSQALLIKDEKEKTIVEIYPWNGIDLIVRDKSRKYQLQTDKHTWFEISFTGTPDRRLSCRLSF